MLFEKGSFIKQAIQMMPQSALPLPTGEPALPVGNLKWLRIEQLDSGTKTPDTTLATTIHFRIKTDPHGHGNGWAMEY